MVSYSTHPSRYSYLYIGNQLKYQQITNGNNRSDEQEEMGRWYRTVSFRQAPENVTDSIEFGDISNQFDIIADSNVSSDWNRSKPILVNNTFRWNNVQKQHIFNQVSRLDSNVNFGGYTQEGCKSYRLGANVHSELVPWCLLNRTLKPDQRSNKALSLGSDQEFAVERNKSRFYETNTNSQTKTTDKLQDSLAYSSETKILNYKNQEESPNSVDDIHIEIESDSDFERDEDVITKRSATEIKPKSHIISGGVPACKRNKTYYRKDHETYEREDTRSVCKEKPVKNLAEVSFHWGSEVDPRFDDGFGTFRILANN